MSMDPNTLEAIKVICNTAFWPAILWGVARVVGPFLLGRGVRG